MHLTVRLGAMFLGKLTQKVLLFANTMLTTFFKECLQVIVVIARRLYKTTLANMFLTTKYKYSSKLPVKLYQMLLFNGIICFVVQSNLNGAFTL